MLIGLMTVRNEDWVLGLSLPAALQVVDEMVVLDHGSTDGTPEILARVARQQPGRLRVLREEDQVWREAALRQRLLEEARGRGGTHFYVIDADEVLSGNLLPRVRSLFAALRPGQALRLPWLALWRDLDRYRVDENSTARLEMVLGFRDSPRLQHSAWRQGYDLHTRVPHRIREGRRHLLADRSQGGILHLAAADWRRLRAKTAWYKMTETVRFPQHRTARELDLYYAADLDEEGLRTLPVDPGWWAPYAPWLGHVRLGEEPWHERECRRLWREHGAAAFTGLELWGVPGDPALPETLEAAS